MKTIFLTIKNLRLQIILVILILLNVSCGPLKFEKTNIAYKPIDAVGGYLRENNDSCFYVFGGKLNNLQTGKILKYRKNTNTWNELNYRFPISVSNATINQYALTSLSEFYHLGGEYNGIIPGRPTLDCYSNFYKININTNPITFQGLSNFPDDGNFKGISRHSTIYINNDLYVFGGIRSDNAVSHFQTMNNLKIYKYNIDNNTWSTLITQLQYPVTNGYIITKLGYYYIFDGKDLDGEGFKVQVLKLNGNDLTYEGSFNVDNRINGFAGLPFIYTRDQNDGNQFYYYPINGDCKIYIKNYNQITDPANSTNNYHFMIDYSDFEFPSNLEIAGKGSVIHGNYISSDWLIISDQGNYFAKPR